MTGGNKPFRSEQVREFCSYLYDCNFDLLQCNHVTNVTKGVRFGGLFGMA